MNRKELYKQITSLNLQDRVKATYGKNYTNCTSAQLAAVVSGATKMLDEAMKSASTVKNKKDIPTEVGPSSFQKLVEILHKKKILLNSEVDAIMNI